MTATQVQTRQQVTLAVRRDAGPPIKDFCLDALLTPGVLEGIEAGGIEAALDLYGVTDASHRAFAITSYGYAPLRLAVETFRQVYTSQLAAGAIPPEPEPLHPGREALDTALFHLLAMHGTLEAVQAQGVGAVADQFGVADQECRTWFGALVGDARTWQALEHVWTAYDLGRVLDIIAETEPSPWIGAPEPTNPGG